MSKDNDENYMDMEGEVIALTRDKFTVLIDNTKMEVLAQVSGKIRISGIRVLVGDRVKIKVSSHDPTKGRIVFRMKE